MSAERPRPRAVFDCMVFLQAAARRGGPSAACFQLAESGVIELFVSREIMVEVRDVLRRPRVRRRFPALMDRTVELFLASVEKRAGTVASVPRLFRFDRDPKDEPYINLAIAADAGFLVSRDTAILDLAATSSSDGERLRHQTPELRILDPVAFLAEVRRRTARGG